MSQDTTKISIFFKEFSVLATEFSEVTHRLNKAHVDIADLLSRQQLLIDEMVLEIKKEWLT